MGHEKEEEKRSVKREEEVSNLLLEKCRQLEEIETVEEWLQKMSYSLNKIGEEHLIAKQEKKKNWMTDHIQNSWTNAKSEERRSKK